MSDDSTATPPRPGSIDRLLGIFSDVRAGEGARALLMLANVFLILVSYYIIKTVREPLILGTEVPGILGHWASAAQPRSRPTPRRDRP